MAFRFIAQMRGFLPGSREGMSHGCKRLETHPHAKSSFSVLSCCTLIRARYPILQNRCRPTKRKTMGRTIPSWRIVVEEELARMARFKQFLKAEDRAVSDDLLSQCKLYASAAGVLASPVREVPLLLSMVFAQHKRLAELEKRMK